LLPELFSKLEILKMKLKNIFALFATLAVVGTVLLTPSFTPALALDPPTTTGGSPQDGLNAISPAYPAGARQTGTDVQTVAKKIIDWALYLAAIISVIFIIIGGYLYITSAGNDVQAGKGRKTLVNALIGLALVVLSYAIVQIVYRFLIT
jgi:hypothetical protein